MRLRVSSYFALLLAPKAFSKHHIHEVHSPSAGSHQSQVATSSDMDELRYDSINHLAFLGLGDDVGKLLFNFLRPSFLCVSLLITSGPADFPNQGPDSAVVQ